MQIQSVIRTNTLKWLEADLLGIFFFPSCLMGGNAVQAQYSTALQKRYSRKLPAMWMSLWWDRPGGKNTSLGISKLRVLRSFVACMFRLVFSFECFAFMIFCWLKPKYVEVGSNLEMPKELMGILL